MRRSAFYDNLSNILLKFNFMFYVLIMYCFFAFIQCYNKNNYGHTARGSVKNPRKTAKKKLKRLLWRHYVSDRFQ